jgi:hypothetical protein
MCDALRLALVSELVHALLSYMPSSSLPSILFPLSPPHSFLLADSTCWLWLQAPCDAAVDVVHDVVGAKRQGRDEATSTVLWQVEAHDAVMFVHVVKSEEKVGR